MTLLLITLLACKGGGDSEGPAFVTGELKTDDSEAEVSGRTAYGFHLDGKGLWYISTAADVSCDTVLTFLNHAEGNDPFDPQDVLYGGYCNISLVLNSYDGSEVQLTEADGVLAAVWSFYCPMGTGEFVLEDRHGHEDYYWTGPLWTGSPTTWSATVSGDGSSGPYTLDLSMDGFDGTYSDVIASIPATGQVSGTIDAVVCPDLYQATVFPK